MANANVSLGIKGVNQTGAAFSSARKSMAGLRQEQFAMGRQMKRNRRVVQQFGMQVSDFAVQVGAGQSAILAFTQNAPQFIQQFGAIGGIMAAAVTIGGVATLMWWRMRGQIKPVSEALDDLSKAMLAYKDSITVARTMTSDMIVKFGSASAEIRQMVSELAAIEKLKTLDEVNALVNSVRAAAGSAGVFSSKYHKALTLLHKDLATTEEGWRKQMNVSLDFLDVLEKLESSGTLKEQLVAMQGVRVEFLKAAGDVELMNKSQRSFLENLTKSILKMSTLASVTDTAAASAKRLAAGLNAVSSGRGNQGAEVMPGMTFAQFDKLYPSGKTGGGGGSDPIEAARKAYDSLMASMNPAIAAAQKYAKAEATIADALRLGVIGREKAAQATQMLQKWTESLTSRLASIPDMVEGLATSIGDSMGDALMSMVDGTKSVSESFRDMAREIIAELYRVLVVQRLVGGIQEFLGGTKGSGGGLVGSLFGARAAGGPVSSGQPYLVGERGPEVMIPNRSGQVLPNGAGGAGQTINMTYQFQGGVTQADLASALPRLVESTKRAIIDATQRGGAVAAVMRG